LSYICPCAMLGSLHHSGLPNFRLSHQPTLIVTVHTTLVHSGQSPTITRPSPSVKSPECE